MSLMLLPRWFALDSRRSPRAPPAKERRRNCFELLVTPLEERQLLTTPTLIAVSASASSLAFGQAEVLTATVQSNPPGTNIPTGGTVTFQNGPNVLGTAPLVNGTASLSRCCRPGLTMLAVYGGTSTYGSSTSTTNRRLHLQPGRQRHLWQHRHRRRCAGDVGRAGQPLTAWPWAPSGVIYIADTFNNQIDYENLNTGVIKVLAGNGTAGLVDGPLLSAEFFDPRGLTFDAQLNALFVADRDNNAIREVNLSTGLVSTVAGTGTFGYSGDGGHGHIRRPRIPDGRGCRPDRDDPVHRRHVQQRGP